MFAFVWGPAARRWADRLGGIQWRSAESSARSWTPFKTFLPDDVTFEDAIERLVFLAKVEGGLMQANAGDTVPHTETKDRLTW
jgi:predicted transcriptional regulator